MGRVLTPDDLIDRLLTVAHALDLVTDPADVLPVLHHVLSQLRHVVEHAPPVPPLEAAEPIRDTVDALIDASARFITMFPNVGRDVSGRVLCSATAKLAAWCSPADPGHLSPP
jgi:hypothetical protein